MKKRSFAAVCMSMAILMLCVACFSACELFGKEEDKEYTIQYTDDAGPHTLTVSGGMPYSLDVVPAKPGYEFLGLFDAEVGGTQYVSASGSSLAPFTDKKNLVLFPQFKAKDYTVILDYQGAPVTGVRQLTVSYGASLPELPKNLTGEHREFLGWFTQPQCGGIQVADQYGLIPLVSVLTEQNFDLSGTSVTLYAGFEPEKHTVTFCFEAGMETEEMQVAYDTPIGKVVPKTRVNGEAVLTWSKTQGGEVWNGKVTSDMVLYAVEYAPVIEFDSDGGSEVISVVARAGSTVALPTPTKDLAKFSHWEDMQGYRYESTTMPSNSISLKAVWQAKLVFDENGGSDVDDISESAGTSIELPTPERDGFIFAGWYTVDKDQYTSTKMPAEGIKLKAGWYKSKEKQFILRTEDEGSFRFDWYYNIASHETNTSIGPRQKDRMMIDLSNCIPNADTTIYIKLHYKMQASWNSFSGGFFFYDNTTISDANLVAKNINTYVAVGQWQEYIFEDRLNLQSNTLYIYYYGKSGPTEPDMYSNACLWFSNIWADIIYPDTTNLYL